MGTSPGPRLEGAPNNVFDSKIGFKASGTKNSDTFLYRTEGVQPHSHEQAALARLNTESELLDLIDFAEFVQYFCDVYRARPDGGAYKVFFLMDRGGDYLGG